MRLYVFLRYCIGISTFYGIMQPGCGQPLPGSAAHAMPGYNKLCYSSRIITHFEFKRAKIILFSAKSAA